MIRNLSAINYSRKFDKQLKRAPLEVKTAFLKRRELFIQDQFHQQLNNHKLSGKFKNYRSINITGDWRAIYSEYDDTIVFEILGTHSQLYK